MSCAIRSRPSRSRLPDSIDTRSLSVSSSGPFCVRACASTASTGCAVTELRKKSRATEAAWRTRNKFILNPLFQARGDEVVELAVEHTLRVALLHAGTQVLDARLV